MEVLELGSAVSAEHWRPDAPRARACSQEEAARGTGLLLPSAYWHSEPSHAGGAIILTSQSASGMAFKGI